MALIPLKQTVDLERATGQKDAAGKPIYAPAVTLKARVSEGLKLTRNKSGAEVSATVSIFLDKLTQVNVDDRCSYTDELARRRTFIVVSYEVKRGVGGQPLFTVVYGQ